MGSVRISVEELEKASDAFEAEFSSGTIHRFPAGLRDVGDRYIVPMVVAIGPYHRALNHLKKTEEVKRAAAFQFSKGWQSKLREEVYDAVLSVAGDARKLYAGDAVVGMGNHDFAAMMFLDACFLLQYMDAAYSRFTSKDDDSSVNQSLRRFLFTNRACINNDIMLLENQLPWLVLETVINSLPSPQPQDKINYMGVVNWFIQDMGNRFKIDVDVKEDKSGVSNNNTPPTPPAPPHLLGLLRRDKIGPATHEEWPRVNLISESSSTELAQIGIKLKASMTALFTDMNVRERGPFCGELSLAPLSLNDTTACWLVNMAAFEVCTAETFQDDPNNTAASSYLALLSMFIHREEDVYELRSRHILHGDQTNAEMLTFFKGVNKLLPDGGSRFEYIMARIQKYKESRRIRTKVYQLVYNNLRTIIQAVGITGTLLGIFQALQSLNQIQLQ